MYGRTYGRAIFSQPKFLGCLGNQILLPMVKSNPVNTDTEGAIDSFLKNGVKNTPLIEHRQNKHL